MCAIFTPERQGLITDRNCVLLASRTYVIELIRQKWSNRSTAVRHTRCMTLERIQADFHTASYGAYELDPRSPLKRPRGDRAHAYSDDC
jgi:hypothetical protein